MFSTSSLKNCKKTENFPFQMAKTFVFDLNVASKPFSTKLPITDFWLNCSWKLWLAFPESISISSPKNLQKTKKCPFQTLRTFLFELKVPSKPFSKKLLMTKFWFKYFWTFCLTILKNDFNFVNQKLTKN